MKKVLFVMLAAMVCFACNQEGEAPENPVGSAVSQFSPQYGQVTRSADSAPWTVEGSIMSEDGVLILQIFGEYSYARVRLCSDGNESNHVLSGEPISTLSIEGHSGRMEATVYIEDEWVFSACFTL